MSGESLERYFRMIRDDRQSRPSGRLWCPAADVYRSKDGWIVKVDLAGIKPADIEITLDDDVLRISGSRRDGICGEGISSSPRSSTASPSSASIATASSPTPSRALTASVR